MTAYFFAIDGGDCIGKSTTKQELIRLLLANPVYATYSIESTRFPGGTEVGCKIRQMLLDKDSGLEIEPWTEVLLFAADMVQTLGEYAKRHKDRDSIVICDRSWLSSYAYQGTLINDPWAVRDLYESIPMPEFSRIWLLDLEDDEVVRRMQVRGTAADRIESRGLDFQASVRRVFRIQQERNRQLIHRIDASVSPKVIAAQIESEIRNIVLGGSMA